MQKNQIEDQELESTQTKMINLSEEFNNSICGHKNQWP